MPRPPGTSKTGGRSKGTPNKRSASLIELFESQKFDPAGQLVALIPKLELKEQANVLMSLLPYLYPKRKSLDVAWVNERSDVAPELEGDSPEAALAREHELRRLLILKARMLPNPRQRELGLSAEELVDMIMTSRA